MVHVQLFDDISAYSDVHRLPNQDFRTVQTLMQQLFKMTNNAQQQQRRYVSTVRVGTFILFYSKLGNF
jgi:hypothetical protein